MHGGVVFGLANTIELPSADQSGIAPLATSGSVIAAPSVALRSTMEIPFDVMICFESGENEKKFDPPPNFVPESVGAPDRKSTRLNSSHVSISYAVFCLKKNIPAS